MADRGNEQRERPGWACWRDRDGGVEGRDLPRSLRGVTFRSRSAAAKTT